MKSLNIIIQECIFIAYHKSEKISLFFLYKVIKDSMKGAIREKLEQAERIALFGHEHIDGDALGAILALGRLLEKQGKTVTYFTPHQPGRVFDFLQLGDKLNYTFDYWDYDVLVFLDFNQYARIWLFTFGHEAYFDPCQKIIIDHHKPEPEPVNTLLYRDTTSISTCGILYELAKERWGELLDSEIATYLYMGLSTDSGNFRYDEWEQSIRTLAIAVELLKLWAKKKLIIDEIFRNKSYRSVMFMKFLLQRVQRVVYPFIAQGWLKPFSMVYSFYEDTELDEFAIDHDEADYGLYVMQDIRNNELVLLIKKVGAFIKTSLRSRGEVDCSKLAGIFWWGGHHNAAGFKIQSSGYIEKDVKEILKKIEAYFVYGET